jgi:hypothetical protein
VNRDESNAAATGLRRGPDAKPHRRIQAPEKNCEINRRIAAPTAARNNRPPLGTLRLEPRLFLAGILLTNDNKSWLRWLPGQRRQSLANDGGRFPAVPILQFRPQHADVFRGFDAKPQYVSMDFQDGDGDVVSDL